MSMSFAIVLSPQVCLALMSGVSGYRVFLSSQPSLFDSRRKLISQVYKSRLIFEIQVFLLPHLLPYYLGSTRNSFQSPLPQ